MIIDSDNRHIRFARSASITAAVHGGGLLINLLLSIVLARVLGAESLGIYASAYALLSWFSVLSCLGVPRLVIGVIPTSMALKQYGAIKGILLSSFVLVVLLSITSAALLYLVLIFSNLFSPEDRLVYAVAAGILPLMSISHVQRASLQGFEQGYRSQVPDTLIRPSVFLIFLIVFSGALSTSTAGDAMFLQAISVLASTLTGLFMLYRCWSDPLRRAQIEYRLKQWGRATLSLCAANISSITMAQIGLSLLPLYEAGDNIGFFRVALSAAALVSVPLVAVNVSLPPAVARLHSLGKKDELRQLVTLSARLALGASFPVLLILFVFGPSILTLLFGAKYVQAYPLLRIMLVGQAFNVACGSCAYILQVCGLEKIASRAFVLAMTVQALLIIVVAPTYGVAGVASAQAFGLTLVNILLMIEVRCRLKLDPTALGLSSFLSSINGRR